MLCVLDRAYYGPRVSTWRRKRNSTRRCGLGWPFQWSFVTFVHVVSVAGPSILSSAAKTPQHRWRPWNVRLFSCGGVNRRHANLKRVLFPRSALEITRLYRYFRRRTVKYYRGEPIAKTLAYGSWFIFLSGHYHNAEIYVGETTNGTNRYFAVASISRGTCADILISHQVS